MRGRSLSCRPVEIDPGEAELPEVVRLRLQSAGALPLQAIGDLDLLKQKCLGFLCSVKCPGSVILKTYDLAVALRDAGIAVVGGFQSPVEKDVLDLLLRGSQPVIVCPARNIDRMRLAVGWEAAIAGGRLLILSPMPRASSRTTATSARVRNGFVGRISDALLVAYAFPGGMVEKTAHDAIAAGKRLWVPDVPQNRGLMVLGARVIAPEEVATCLVVAGEDASPRVPSRRHL